MSCFLFSCFFGSFPVYYNQEKIGMKEKGAAYVRVR